MSRASLSFDFVRHAGVSLLPNHDFRNSPLQVLFADDNLLDAVLLRYGFRAAQIDCHVHHVNSGAAARQWLECHETPDAVVLDLRLSTESGLDVLIALEARPEMQAVAKVILSALTPGHLESEIAAHGALCLEKPFALEGWAEIARSMSARQQSAYAHA